MELLSTRESDSTHIRITVRVVGSLKEGDAHYIQFFNIIMRKCLDYLKLQLVGRNYFDAQNKVSSDYCLKLQNAKVYNNNIYNNNNVRIIVRSCSIDLLTGK